VETRETYLRETDWGGVWEKRKVGELRCREIEKWCRNCKSFFVLVRYRAETSRFVSELRVKSKCAVIPSLTLD